MPEDVSAVSDSKAVAPANNVETKNAPSGEVDSNTLVADMGALRREAPKVYNAMILGIATAICWEQKRHADHLKKMIREASNR